VVDTTIGASFDEQVQLRRRDNVRTYLLLIVFALFLVALVAPYRSVHLPLVLMVALGLIFVLVCAKFSIEEYDRLMLMFCVFAPFQKVLPGGFSGIIQGFNITNIFAFFLIIGWAVQTLRHERRFYEPRAIDVPVLIFCLFGVVSLFRGEMFNAEKNAVDSIFLMKEWLLPMIVYIIVVNNVKDRDTLVRLVVAICITTALIGFLGLKKYYLDEGGLYNAYGSSYDAARIGVICKQPNEFGAFFCYYTFLMLAFFFVNWRKARYWLLLLPIAACARSMLLTFSRGSQVAFLAGIGVTILFWNRKVFLFIFLPIVVFFAYNPDYLPGFMVGRMQNTVQSDGSFDGSTQARLEVWKCAIRMIRANPLLGVGYDNFQYYTVEYGLPPNVHGIDAHNTYFLYAAEMGIPAAACFIIVLLICWRKGIFIWLRTQDRFFRTVSIGFLGGLAGLMAANCFGSRLNSNEIVFQFWILIAIMTKMAQVTRTDYGKLTEVALEHHRRSLRSKIVASPVRRGAR